MAANHVGDAPHHEFMRSREGDAVGLNRRIGVEFRVNRYEKLKIRNPLWIALGSQGRSMIRFVSMISVRGVMTV